jgi:hypothetical protein
MHPWLATTNGLQSTIISMAYGFVKITFNFANRCRRIFLFFIKMKNLKLDGIASQKILILTLPIRKPEESTKKMHKAETIKWIFISVSWFCGLFTKTELGLFCKIFCLLFVWRAKYSFKQKKQHYYFQPKNVYIRFNRKMEKKNVLKVLFCSTGIKKEWNLREILLNIWHFSNMVFYKVTRGRFSN